MEPMKPPHGPTSPSTCSTTRRCAACSPCTREGMSSVERRAVGFTPSGRCGRRDPLRLIEKAQDATARAGRRHSRPSRHGARRTGGALALHRKLVEDLKPLILSPIYASPGEAARAPRHTIPDVEMSPDTAYQFVRDELMLDGNARLNLATFVTTWMEPQAERLMTETFDKNMIAKDEYPRTAELEQRCVNMLSRLWSSPDQDEATGTSTTGSSEAAMLAGMALKWRWRDRQRGGRGPARTPHIGVGG